MGQTFFVPISRDFGIYGAVFQFLKPCPLHSKTYVLSMLATLSLHRLMLVCGYKAQRIAIANIGDPEFGPLAHRTTQNILRWAEAISLS